MPTIHFLPMGVSAECADGETIFEVGKRHSIVIETACVGKGTCGLCRVKVLAGDDSLSPYGDIDEKHLGNVYHLTRVRLSCQARVHGDVTVELAPKRRAKKNPSGSRNTGPGRR